MSRTIRNEKTRGYLDKLQKERETRKILREMKYFDWTIECDVDTQDN
jgi:hypothetical protein